VSSAYNYSPPPNSPASGRQEENSNAEQEGRKKGRQEKIRREDSEMQAIDILR
jgi:hypothetical protein